MHVNRWFMAIFPYITGHALGIGSAGAVCSIKESSGSQNQRVHVVLKASKSAGAKCDDIPADLYPRACVRNLDLWVQSVL